MTKDDILKKLASGEMKLAEASKALDDLNRKALFCKVSEKGGVSVYGLQRMPVTLYDEQWDRLLDFGPQIRDFIKANAAKMSKKGDKKATAAAPAQTPPTVEQIAAAALPPPPPPAATAKPKRQRKPKADAAPAATAAPIPVTLMGVPVTKAA